MLMAGSGDGGPREGDGGREVNGEAGVETTAMCGEDLDGCTPFALALANDEAAMRGGMMRSEGR